MVRETFIKESKIKNLLHSIYLWWHDICPLCEKGKKGLRWCGYDVSKDPYCRLCLRKREHLVKEREKFAQAKEDELFGEWQKNFVYDFSLDKIINKQTTLRR